MTLESTPSSISNACYTRVHAQLLSHVQLFATPMDSKLPGSSVHRILQQEYWSGLPFLSPGDLPDPGIKPTSPVSPALHTGSLPLSHQESNIKIGTKEKFHQGEMVTKRESVSMLRKMRKFHRISNLKKGYRHNIQIHFELL